MKKKIAILVVFVLVLALAMSFVACNDGNVEGGLKVVTVIIGEDVYHASTECEYVHDLLVEMSEKNTIVYEFDMGSYGATVMQLNDLHTDSDWSPYICVYHSIDDVTIRDMSGYGETFIYNQIVFYSSGVGVSSLPVVNGATYLFREV